MTVWVVREGRLVEKRSLRAAAADRRGIFPTPNISRMEPYQSPVTDLEISTWREREADMAAVGAVDPRDLPKPGEETRNARKPADAPFQWGGVPDA